MFRPKNIPVKQHPTQNGIPTASFKAVPLAQHGQKQT
jgi:hypothetical protein